METNKPARKHRSAVLAKVMEQTSPVEKLQAEVKMSLAARLDDLIAASNYVGKSNFATAVNKNPSEITKWLSGTQNFTIDTLAEIAYALNVSIGELFAIKRVQIIHTYHIVATLKIEQPVRLSTPIAETEAIPTYSWDRKDFMTPLPSLLLS